MVVWVKYPWLVQLIKQPVCLTVMMYVLYWTLGVFWVFLTHFRLFLGSQKPWIYIALMAFCYMNIALFQRNNFMGLRCQGYWKDINSCARRRNDLCSAQSSIALPAALAG